MELHGKEANRFFAAQIEKNFRITIPEKPFSGEPLKFTDKNFPPGQGYQELLTNNELLYLAAAVKDLSLDRLEAVLRRVYHLGDDTLKTLTWDKIGVYCQDLIDTQNPPAKTTKKIKEPTEGEREAYNLTRALGCKQSEAAEIMNKEGLKNAKGGKITQSDVSRWAAAFATWLKRQGLPVEKYAPKAGKTVVNNDAFASGARSDGRKPHQKAEK